MRVCRLHAPALEAERGPTAAPAACAEDVIQQALRLQHQKALCPQHTQTLSSCSHALQLGPVKPGRQRHVPLPMHAPCPLQLAAEHAQLSRTAERTAGPNVVLRKA